MSHMTARPGEMPCTSCLIGGRAVDGAGPEFEIENPATEEIIATVRAASPTQVNEAVESARNAFFQGHWSDPALRAGCIDRLADLLEAHEEELVALLVAEVGTPIATARPLHVKVAVSHLRHAAEAAQVDRTVDLGAHHDPVSSHSLIAYRPIGVVAAIAAYNYPLLISAAKLGNAWAAGCTTVLLPSSQAPLAVLRLGELAMQAGFPAGVLNVIVGGPEIGEALTAHPHVDKVSFTGSVRTGQAVMAQAARNLTSVTLELGGKSGAILLPGSNHEALAEGVHARYLRNAGQGCASPTRILVERARIGEFIDASRVAFAGFEVGDPWRESVLVGPLISRAHRDHVEAMVAQAIGRGAEIVAGGGKATMAKGHFMNPALLAGVTNGDRIAREELFGPVGVLLPYDDVDEAVAIANDSEFGLTASLFGPTETCLALAPRLRVGTVTINGGGGLRPDAPLCGFNDSGIGSEGGEDGVREFLKTQHIQFPVAAMETK